MAKAVLCDKRENVLISTFNGEIILLQDNLFRRPFKFKKARNQSGILIYILNNFCMRPCGRLQYWKGKANQII